MQSSSFGEALTLLALIPPNATLLIALLEIVYRAHMGLVASIANGMTGVKYDGTLKPTCRTNLPFGIIVTLTLLEFFLSSSAIISTGNCSVTG
jgi:hypothetical protein